MRSTRPQFASWLGPMAVCASVWRFHRYWMTLPQPKLGATACAFKPAFPAKGGCWNGVRIGGSARLYNG